VRIIMSSSSILGLILGFVLGALVSWIAAQFRAGATLRKYRNTRDDESATLAAALSEAEQQRAALGARVERIPTLEGTISELTGRLDRAQSEHARLTGEVGRLASLQERINQLDSEISRKDTALAQSQIELQDYNRRAGRLSELENQLSSLQLQIKERDDALAANTIALTSLHNQLGELSTTASRVPQLESLIESKDVVLLQLRNELSDARKSYAELSTQLTEERKATDEKIQLIQTAQQQFRDSFQALSADALQANNSSFLDLAKAALSEYQQGAKLDLDARTQGIQALLTPVQESLSKVDASIRDLERARTDAYAELRTHVKSMEEAQVQLRSETSNLVRALRAPAVRGRWGEMQLRRVIELAGLLDHCDFHDQVSTVGDEGRLRADVIVHLPGSKNVIIDAKVPLQAFLDSLDATDDESREHQLKEHARLVRNHMSNLGSKAYWTQFKATPEFVVMFVPGESCWGAAVQQDPSLIEYGVDQKVLAAHPITLIGLLRSVAYGWQQERIAESAESISALGKELYERLAKLGGHFTDLRRGIEKTVDAYNSAVGSLENRVFVSARRFRDLGIGSSDEIAPVVVMDRTVRSVQSDELIVDQIVSSPAPTTTGHSEPIAFPD
jgi:DNA recombination protein RmuC